MHSRALVGLLLVAGCHRDPSGTGPTAAADGSPAVFQPLLHGGPIAFGQQASGTLLDRAGRIRLVRDGHWLEAQPTGVRASFATADALVHLHEQGSLVRTSKPLGIEDTLLAASPTASLAYHVRVDAGLEVRVAAGRFEARDAEQHIVFTTQVAWVVDSLGRKHPARLALEPEPGGTLLTFSVDGGLVAPIAVDPIWSTGGSMGSLAADRQAVKLPSGKVFVGDQIYDPTTNAWTTTAPAPAFDALAPLPGGKVLGVYGQDYPSATAQIYDPVTNKWTATGGIAARRVGFVLASLPSGRVLLAGGQEVGLGVGAVNTDRAQSWEYDPTAGTWSSVGPLIASRSATPWVTLADGRILVAGGFHDVSDYSATLLASAEIYNPTTKSWVTGGAMAAAKAFHTLTLLPSNKVLAAGGGTSYYTAGSGTPALSTTEIFDPAGPSWTAGPTMVGRRARHQATLLPGSGLVVVMGGSDISEAIFTIGKVSTAELFDPTKPGGGAFTATASMASARERFPAVATDGNHVLAIGGEANGITYVGAELYTALVPGLSCSAGSQCLSGNCVDGVCCDAPCAASCFACNVAGKVGTCSAIPAGEAPRGGRASCSPFLCGTGGVCATTCAADTDCASGSYCDTVAKKCFVKKSNGTTCGRVGECTSGQCVDTVCCDSACSGQCEACDVAASKGTCSPVSGAPHTARAACATGTGKTCELQLCNGSDRTACHYPSVSTTCSGNACTSGIETHASTCDGVGACKDVPKDCGVYKCGASACKTTCGTKADCLAGYSCVGGACTPSIGLGKPCSDDAACGDLLCVNGVCCGVDAPATKCADGYICNAPGKEGTCMLANGSKCDLASKCGSGFCVDGVCCDRACDGQCEACDVGKGGTCTGVAGAPHGSRPACDAGGTGPDVCKARTCNGAADTKSCVGYVNDSSKLCAPKKCVGSDFSDFSFCDGAGTCKSPGASSCVPYKCDDTGCLKACTSGEQCADGFQCKDGKCVQGATCKDATTSVSKDGKEEPCGAYRCTSTGACGKECVSTDNCAPGYACDGRACVPVAASSDTGDSGGCVVGAPRPGSPVRAASFVLFGLVALGAARRRRR